MDDGDVQRRFRGDESVRRGWTGGEGICLPDGAWNWINHPRPGPVISSQPHLGDHYICLCMLNILWNYTRQVSKSCLSLYYLSFSFTPPFSPNPPLIPSPQRDRETITITGHSSLVQDYFPGEKRSAKYRQFPMRVFYACQKNLSANGQNCARIWNSQSPFNQDKYPD